MRLIFSRRPKLEADGAFKFVLPRLPEEAYIFPPPEAEADEEFDVYG